MVYRDESSGGRQSQAYFAGESSSEAERSMGRTETDSFEFRNDQTGGKGLWVVPRTTAPREDDCTLRLARSDPSRISLLSIGRGSVLPRSHRRDSNLFLPSPRSTPLDPSSRFHLRSNPFSTLVEPLGLSRPEPLTRDLSNDSTPSKTRSSSWTLVLPKDRRCSFSDQESVGEERLYSRDHGRVQG